MDVTKMLADLKRRPGFAENVGMVLTHSGVVRAWARADHAPVVSVRVTPDRERIRALCREAAEGELLPGDDLLTLVVAGDIREHVKATFAELLDRIKGEAIVKEERTAR